MLKRKNGQPLLSDMMVTKKLKADPVHPTDSIHLDVDEHYTVNENVYYDSVKSDLFLKQIKGQNKKIEDFNDSDISMEQQIIRDRLLCLETRENMLITGEAGTGKTFVQNVFNKSFERSKAKCVSNWSNAWKCCKFTKRFKYVSNIFFNDTFK